MQVSWRRNNFLKAPKFQNTWVDSNGRKFMFVKNTGSMRWAMFDSSEWGDNDILAYVRVGKNADGETNELPMEGDGISVAKGAHTFSFVVTQVFRNVGRTKTVPMVIQPSDTETKHEEDEKQAPQTVQGGGTNGDI